jgi:putative two-component system response regulator
VIENPMPEPPATVLVVEDDDAGRALVQTLLEQSGYSILAAADGPSGLRLAREHEPNVIVLDVGLPGLSGLELTRTLRQAAPTRTIPIILLTGHASIDDMAQGLDAGADDFVAKPFRRLELLARVRSAVRMRQAILGMETARSVVAALAGAVAAKDPVTEHHCQRLAGLAGRLGARLGLVPEEREALEYGAVLHDVGKIGIPEAILLKPGPLTPEEWTILRRHPEIGAEICRPLGLSRRLSPVIRHHHERWDGAGYPDRLRGDQIPLGARVIAVLDTYDAMTHDRPYRAARSSEQALEDIRSQAGRQLDPALTSLLEAEINLAPLDDSGVTSTDDPVTATAAGLAMATRGGVERLPDGARIGAQGSDR